MQLQEPTLKGRKPTSLTEEEEQWIVSIYIVFCGTLQKKYGSFHKALTSYFPLKRFFPFFLFFLLHTKEMIGSFPNTFLILNITQEKVFFPFFLFSLFNTKEIIGNFPKTFIISNSTEEKAFLFRFQLNKDVLPLM